MLTKMGDKFKKQGWGWVWSEGATQLDLESALDVGKFQMLFGHCISISRFFSFTGGFGYPALAVVSAKKMKYSLLTGSFGHDGIHEFLRDLSYGKGRTNPVRGAKLPKVSKVEAWDGKDGQLPEEEDIDLSDVELDDLGKEEL